MPARQVLHVYVDESSQTGHEFMAIGAIFCGADAAQEIAAEMDACLARHRQRPDKEFHWTELKGHTLELYKDVLGKLIGFTQAPRKMRYRALVVDMKQVDRAMNRDRNREAQLAALVFALVLGFARGHDPGVAYHVHIDKRADSVHDAGMSERTLAALNAAARHEFGLNEDAFVTVDFVDSKSSRLIQATDMITGAIAYETNRKHLSPDASAYRLALLQHVILNASLQTLAASTPKGSSGLQIARFDHASRAVIRG